MHFFFKCILNAFKNAFLNAFKNAKIFPKGDTNYLNRIYALNF
jgi:hypothetical protein